MNAKNQKTEMKCSQSLNTYLVTQGGIRAVARAQTSGHAVHLHRQLFPRVRGEIVVRDVSDVPCKWIQPRYDEDGVEKAAIRELKPTEKQPVLQVSPRGVILSFRGWHVLLVLLALVAAGVLFLLL